MKLKDIGKSIDTLEKYFDKEDKLDFEIAEKLCDLIPLLKEQSQKYDKLLYKFLRDYYSIEEDGSTYTVKDKSQLDFILNEKEKLEGLEFLKEKETLPKMEKIYPKVLIVLREFFIFE